VKVLQRQPGEVPPEVDPSYAAKGLVRLREDGRLVHRAEVNGA